MTVLVAIEGIDGAGKGTQSGLLKKRLRNLGYQTDLIQFPRYSATNFGRAIGDFLNGRFGALDEVHPQLAAVLYAGDRFESLSAIEKSMTSNEVLLLDRFTASNLAHQAAKLHGKDRAQLIDWIDDIEHRVFGLPRPSLNVLLDVSTTWSQKLVSRKKERDYTSAAADLQENDQAYLNSVRQCYLDIARSRHNWSIVECLNRDGELRAIEAISDDILACITPLLNDLVNPATRQD